MAVAGHRTAPSTAQYVPFLFPPYTMHLRNRLPQTAEECQDLESIVFDPGLEHRAPDGEIITDDDLASILPYCSHLKEVDLRGVRDLSDRTLLLLGEHTDVLKVVDISGSQYIGTLGVCELAARATKLQVLRLASVWAITDPVVTVVVRTLGHLTELDLSDLPLITSHSVREIWTFSRNLRVLNVSRCKNLTDKAFPSPLPSESTFQLGGSKSLVVPPTASSIRPSTIPRSGDANAKSSYANSLPPLVLPSHHALQYLQSVDVSYCLKLTDDAIAGLIQHAPHISELYLAGCAQMTNRALQSIGKLKEHLAGLDLSRCQHFTDDGISKLVRSCPRIKSINISCKRISYTSWPDNLLTVES